MRKPSAVLNTPLTATVAGASTRAPKPSNKDKIKVLKEEQKALKVQLKDAQRAEKALVSQLNKATKETVKLQNKFDNTASKLAALATPAA